MAALQGAETPEAILTPRPAPEPEDRRRRRLGVLLAVLLFAGGVAVLVWELSSHPLSEITGALVGIPLPRLLLALGLTVATYLALTTYDLMALRFIDHPLPYRHIVQASFVGYAFSHNMALSIVSGTGPRWRIYSAWGLTGKEVAHVVTFTHLTFYVGLVTAAGSVLVLFPRPLPTGFPLLDESFAPLGWVLLGLVAAYLAWSLGGRGQWLIRRWEVPRPTFGFALLQVVAGGLEWALTTAVLFVLLPGAEGLGFAAFMSIFVVAQIAGMASQVPGGTGVFEAGMVLLLAPYLDAPAALGPLIAYRALFYLLPFVVALGLLAIHEVEREEIRRRVAVRPWGRKGRRR